MMWRNDRGDVLMMSRERRSELLALRNANKTFRRNRRRTKRDELVEVLRGAPRGIRNAGREIARLLREGK